MNIGNIHIPYEEIVENALDCFWIVDMSDGTVVHTNESYCQMSGYSKDEIVGKKVIDFEVGEDIDVIKQTFITMEMDGRLSFLATHRKKDGTIARLETNGIFKQIDGKKYIFAFMRDATEKLEIQEKFSALNRQLIEIVKNETQKRLAKDVAFSTVFDIFGTGVAITDGIGGILDLNKEFCNIFKIKNKEDAIGKKLCAVIHDLPIEEADKKFEEVISLTNAFTKSCERRIDCTSCSSKQFEAEFDVGGKKIYSIANISCYKDKQNDINFVFSITDITAKRELEKKQKQSEKLLISQSRMAAMGEMIGAIAHQWRQPLNLLGILVQDLGFSYSNGDVSKEYIDTLIEDSMKQIGFMSKTIDDFRGFFRTDKMKSDFLLDKKVAESLSMVSGMLKANGIELKSEVQNKPIVVGYPNELSQVVLNLISNAKDAFEDISKTAHRVIEILITADETYGIAQITDNAGGIDEEIIGRIFDPYFTTKEEGKGTGIGLYMSKTIVETNMGGLLEVANKDNGAVFTIKIPLAEGTIGG